ncbi:MAG: hypothetical protein K2H49_09010 [Muribaculaceae bacterium]|nr:hypothetical protein [Muribaculaceae bacterium]
MKILADINTRKNDIASFLCFLLAGALLLWAAYAAWIHFRTSPPYIDKEKYPISGIDISAHNGKVDLQKAAAGGVDFVWMKATEGVTFQDRNFAVNHKEAGEAGLARGAYHFFRFDKDGVEQAINLLETIGDRGLELGVAIDVESSGNPTEIDVDTVKDRISAMVDYLNLRGIAPTLYCNKKDYYQYLADSFPGNSLWICSFSDDPISADWTFWQYSHKGNAKGIKGNVDLNVFSGTEEEWQQFISQQQYQGNNYVN